MQYNHSIILYILYTKKCTIHDVFRRLDLYNHLCHIVIQYQDHQRWTGTRVGCVVFQRNRISVRGTLRISKIEPVGQRITQVGGKIALGGQQRNAANAVVCQLASRANLVHDVGNAAYYVQRRLAAGKCSHRRRRKHGERNPMVLIVVWFVCPYLICLFFDIH